MRASGRGQSALLLLDVAALLTREQVEYAVIGAMAASVHGAIRATIDADALLSVTIPRLGKLAHVFKKTGLQAALRRGDADDPIPALLAVSDRYGNRVDLLGGLRGLDPEIFSRAITVSFLGADIQVVGREDFIAIKCLAGGPQDIADARHVLKATQGPVDVDLLRRVTRRFGRAAADALEQVLG